MAWFGKKALSEADAATSCVSVATRATQEAWPQIVDQIRRLLDTKAPALDSPSTQLEFATACVSVQCQAIPNLFLPEQATRLFAHIQEVLGAPELEGAALEAFQAYWSAWQDALRNGEMPSDAVAAKFCNRVGLAQARSGPSGRFINPALLTVLGAQMTSVVAPFWKSVQQKYRVVA